MKIAKRQLRRIIKETHPDYKGLPQSDVDYYELADDYALWVEDFGQGAENPSHPGVMASYFLEKGLEDDHAKHEMLGKAFQVNHADIMKELELQAADQKAAEEILSTRMGDYSSSSYRRNTNEGTKMKITKRQLKRIIKEEKARLIKERIVEHPLQRVAASAGSIAKGIASGQLGQQGAAQRLEAEVVKALYDFIRQEKGQ